MGKQTTPTFGAFSRVSARNRQTGESGRKTPQTHTAVGETAILDTISKGCSKDYLPDLRPARWLFHGPPAGSKFLAATPQGHGLGKTSRKRGDEHQFNKSLREKIIRLGMEDGPRWGISD